MESIVEALHDGVEWVNPQPAIPEQIVLAPSPAHMEQVKARGLYPIDKPHRSISDQLTALHTVAYMHDFSVFNHIILAFQA